MTPTRKMIWTGLAVVMILMAIAVLPAAAAVRMNTAHGHMTAVETDGTVIIDDKGYSMDPQAKVRDAVGKEATVGSLELPAAVYFEYVHTEQGALIKTLQVTPE